MTTRDRSGDLTADLLYDIAEERPAPAVTAPAVARTSAAGEDVAPAPSFFLMTSLFLPPRAWLRPGVTRSGTTMSLSAGPVRLRIGHGR